MVGADNGSYQDFSRHLFSDATNWETAP